MRLQEYVSQELRYTMVGEMWKRRDSDRSEILAYIAQNGPVSRFDIELCTHQGAEPVLKHLAALQRQGKIARDGRKYVVIS